MMKRVVQTTLRRFRTISKASSIQNATKCFLFQIKVPSLIVKVIHQFLTSSSSSSHPLYIFFRNFFDNIFHKAVPTRNVTSPVSLPSFYHTQDIDFLLGCTQYFLIFLTVGPTDLVHPSSAPHFKTLKVSLELRLEF